MSRQFDIINELEIDYGVQLHANDIPGDTLCQHDTCIHEDCTCWGLFREQIERDLMVAQAQAKVAILLCDVKVPEAV